MSAFTAPITRREGKSFGRASHWYVDANGLKIPGVTSILSDGLPKPALVGWGIKSVAEYAIDHWDDLAEEKPSDRLKTLKGSPYAVRDEAASRGTAVHHIAERLAAGEEVEYEDELAGHVESAVRFLDEWQPRVILAEKSCYNLEYGWAGTFDLIAEFPDGRTALLDYKTSKGVYPDTGLQLAAYRYSTHYTDDAGEPQPMPAVDWCGVVHVRADGYDVYELRADESVLLRMRYVAAVARLKGEMPAWKSDALPAPIEAVA